MNIRSLSLGPIGTNCYLLEINKDVIIIDPGAEPEKIKAVIASEKLNPVAILLTHAHFDHIGAVDAIRDEYKLEVYLHEDEHKWLEDTRLNGSASLIGNGITVREAENTLVPGKLTLGTFNFEVIHTPGHSPGSVSFLFNEEKTIVSGDVLFYEGIGRTDLFGGNYQQIEQSIRSHFYTLSDDYIVYPGHGPKTTIGHEKVNNPFIRFN